MENTVLLNRHVIADTELSDLAKIVALAVSGVYGDRPKDSNGIIKVKMKEPTLEHLIFEEDASRWMREHFKKGLAELQKHGLLRGINIKKRWPQNVQILHLCDNAMEVNLDDIRIIMKSEESYRFNAASMYMRFVAEMESQGKPLIDIISPYFKSDVAEADRVALVRLSNVGVLATREGILKTTGKCAQRILRVCLKKDEQLLIDSLEGYEFIEQNEAFVCDSKKIPGSEIAKYLQYYKTFTEGGKKKFSYETLKATYEHILKWNRHNRRNAILNREAIYNFRNLACFKDYDFYNKTAAYYSIAPIKSFELEKEDEYYD